MLQDLEQHWADKPCWTVLEITHPDSQHFAAVRALWCNSPAAPKLLHYVALVQDLPAALAFAEQACSNAGPLYPGFNRVLLEGGRLSLTLCIGQTPRMLTELRAQANMVFMAQAPDAWTDAHWKQLALNCRVGARIYGATHAVDEHALARNGFALHGLVEAVFAPHWTIKRSRRAPHAEVTAVSCAVIGGGLSGAAVAHALALRGWQVTVFDTHNEAAAEASGVPVGLCVAQSAADANPQKRLSRQGVRINLWHASELLRCGTDWKPTCVLEKVDLTDPERALLHTHAAWLKPAALVRAWLSHENITWVGGNRVTALARSGSQWILRGASPYELGRAEHVVFANAMGCKTLIASLANEHSLGSDVLRKLSVMRAVHGGLSFAADRSCPASLPMNGSGSWISGVPTPSGAHWYAGASYEADPARVQDLARQHASNLLRLSALDTQAAAVMAAAIADQTVGLWSGTRCVTQDRLPLVGPIESGANPSLWICAGMGSRGLSLSALCAELLVAYMHGEPLPVEHSLSHSLSVSRPAKGRPVTAMLNPAD